MSPNTQPTALAFYKPAFLGQTTSGLALPPTGAGFPFLLISHNWEKVKTRLNGTEGTLWKERQQSQEEECI